MIQLTDKIVVTADEHQFIVGRPRQRTRKDGNQAIGIDSPSYFTSLSNAVKFAVTQSMRDSVANGTITTLREFIAEQERVQNEFARLLEPLEA